MDNLLPSPAETAAPHPKSSLLVSVKKWWAACTATPFPGLLAGLIAVIGAEWLLLLHPYSLFYYDMDNTMWMMTYQGRHFLETGSFAMQFTNQQVCGMPYPLFYGWGFFPVGGLLTNLIGANLAVRAFVFGAMAIQYAHVIRLGRRIGLPWGLRHATAVALTWSIYALTNLYTRSALMEFIALDLVGASLCCWLIVTLETPAAENRYDRWAWGFYYMLASVTHPITLLYGGVLLALCGGVALVFVPHRWLLAKNGICTLGAWLVCMHPWLSVMAMFHGIIPVGYWPQLRANFGWSFLMDRWQDHVRVKLFPLARELWGPPTGKFLGHLDTQIADALLLAALVMTVLMFFRPATPAPAFRRRIGPALALLGAVVAVICFIGACVPEWTSWTTTIFAPAQTPYRLISYVNLGLFLVIASLGSVLAPLSPQARRFLAVTSVLMLALATMGLVSKLRSQVGTFVEAKKVWTWLHPRDVVKPLDCFYGRGDYSTWEQLPELKPNGMPERRLVFSSVRGGQLEDVPAQGINLPVTTLITTQIQVFPWNHLLVDGRDPSLSMLGYNRDADHDNPSYACVLPPGPHILAYEYLPWEGLGSLRVVAALAAMIWGSCVAWMVVCDFKRSRLARIGRG